MIIDQKQVLIKETTEAGSVIYDAASMRELLAKNGASYTLLDGSSMSPIPFVEGRQVGPNLELLMPDGTTMTVSNYFGSSGLPGEAAATVAQFSPDTQVYFPEYKPAASMASSGFDSAFTGAMPNYQPMMAPQMPAATPATSGLGQAAMQSAASALPAAAMMAGAGGGGSTYNIGSSGSPTGTPGGSGNITVGDTGDTVINIPSGTDTTTGGTDTTTGGTDTTSVTPTIGDGKIHIFGSKITDLRGKPEAVPQQEVIFEVTTDASVASVQLLLDGQTYTVPVVNSKAEIKIDQDVINLVGYGPETFVLNALDASGAILQQSPGSYAFNQIGTATESSTDQSDTSSNSDGSTILGVQTSFGVSLTKSELAETPQLLINTDNAVGHRARIYSAGQLLGEATVAPDGLATVSMPSTLIVDLAGANVPFTVQLVNDAGDNTASFVSAFYVDPDVSGVEDISTGTPTPAPTSATPSISGYISSFGGTLSATEATSNGQFTVYAKNVTTGSTITGYVDGQQVSSAVLVENGIASISVPSAILEELTAGIVAVHFVLADAAGTTQSIYTNSFSVPGESTSTGEAGDLADAAYLAAMTALINAINGIGTGSGGTTTINPVITGITTSFGTSVSLAETEAAAVITVNTNGINDGETISLSFGDLNYTAQVVSNKAAFAISAGDMQTIAEGNYTATATLQSDATVTKSLNILVDTSAPEFATTDDPIQTSVDENIPTSTIVFTAIAADANSVSYSIKGTDSAYFTINSLTGELKFKASPDFETKESYALTIVATDIAGNASERAMELAINDLNEDSLDLPAIPTVDVLTTNLLAPTITGTAVLEVGDVLTVTVEGATYTVIPAADGTWSLDLNSTTPTTGEFTALVDGNSYDVFAKVTNSAGSSYDTTAYELTIDASVSGAPTVDTLVTSSLTPVISGTASLEAGERLDVSVSGATYTVTPTEGVWQLDLGSATPAVGSLSELQDGQTYDIDAVIKDSSGNSVSDTSSSELRIDTTAPTVYLLIEDEAEAELGIGETATVTLRLTEVLDDQTPLTLDAFNVTGGALTDLVATNDPLIYSATLVPANNFSGTVTVELIQDQLVDSAGNALILGNDLSPKIDTKPPAALTLALEDTGVSESDGVTNDYTVSLTNLENNASWQYSTDAGSSWSAGSVGASFFSLAEGNYESGSIIAKQVDAFGNEGAESLLSIGESGLEVDRTGPGIEKALVAYTTAVVDDETIATGKVTLTFANDAVISGTASSNDAIVLSNIVSQNSQATLTSIDPVNKTLVFSFSGTLVDEAERVNPDYLFLNSVAVKDIAGNYASTNIDSEAIEYALGVTILTTSLDSVDFVNPEDDLIVSVVTFGVADDQSVKLSLTIDGNEKDYAVSGLSIDDADGIASFTIPAADLGYDQNLPAEILKDVTYTVAVVDLNNDVIEEPEGYPITKTGDFILDNVAPVFEAISKDNLDIDENSVWIGESFSAIDESITVDAPVSNITYSLLPEDQKYFSINPATGKVTISSSLSVLDHESMTELASAANSTDKVITIRVVATDEAGNSTEHEVEISVKDVDESDPLADALTHQIVSQSSSGDETLPGIYENSGSNQIVYDASQHFTDTADIDSSLDTSSALTYSFKLDADGDPVFDGSQFTINPTSGIVSLDANPNYEMQSEYIFTVLATDAAGNDAQQTVTLNILDVAENTDVTAPNFVYVDTPNQTGELDLNETALQLKIPENTLTDGYIYKFTLDDASMSHDGAIQLVGDDADKFDFALTSDADNSFVELTFKQGVDLDVLDYETDQRAFNLGIQATDANGNAKTLDLVVSVVDVAAPTFTSSDTLQIQEGITAVGSTVYTATATPVESTNVTYSISSQTDDLFSINAATGAVTLNKNLDKESYANGYSFVVAANSGNEVSEKTVTLNILDQNGPSVSDITWDVTSVGAGTIVPITVTFSDAVNVTGYPQLRLLSGDSSVAFAQTATYQSGSGSNSLTFAWTVPSGLDISDLTVEVANIILPTGTAIKGTNGFAADIGYIDSIASLDDLLTVDTVHPNFVAVDVNGELLSIDTSASSIDLSVPENILPAGYPFTFALDVEVESLELSGADSAEFELTTATIGGIQYATVQFVATQDAFDYEDATDNSYTVDLVAKDVNGTAIKTLTLNIAEADVPSPVITGVSNQTINESDFVIGDVVATASSVAGDVTYSIESQDGDALAIDSNTGEISLVSNLDYETQASYSYTVKAEAQGEVSTATSTITIEDNAAPTISSVAWSSVPATISLYDNISVIANFDGAVAVTGTPKLLLSGVDSNGTAFEMYATYNSTTSTSTALYFDWMVTEGIEADSLELNVVGIELDSTSSILENGSSSPADVSFEGLALSGTYTINTNKPDITDISYSQADNTVTITFSEALDIQPGTTIDLTSLGSDLGSYSNSGTQTDTTSSIVFSGSSVAWTTDEEFQTFLLETKGFVQVTVVSGSPVVGSSSGLPLEDPYWITSDMSVSVAAGRFVTEEMAVRIYDEAGQLLAESGFNPLNGIVRYEDLLPSDYQGKILVQVYDTNGAAGDYLDEYTNSLVDLSTTTNGFGLRAVVDYDASIAAQPVTVSPLTELAVRLAEVQTGSAISEEFDYLSASLDQFFGVAGSNESSVSFITDEDYNLADGVSSAEHYGLVLAALSTLDNVTGSINETLNLLLDRSDETKALRDETITKAIELVTTSESPYMAEIAPQLAVVLDRFYDYDELLHGFEVHMAELDSVALEHTSDTLLDLSYLFEDAYDFEMLIDDEFIVAEEPVPAIAESVSQLPIVTDYPNVITPQDENFMTGNDGAVYG